MEGPWEDVEGEEFSPEEAQIMRFQQTNELQLKSANLGFDMDRLVHVDPAGKHLIQTSIDELHASLMLMLDADLQSEEARKIQVHAKACKMVVDIVMETLENGRTAAFDLADQAGSEEDDHG